MSHVYPLLLLGPTAQSPSSGGALVLLEVWLCRTSAEGGLCGWGRSVLVAAAVVMVV
jgi:hypothetical protein